MCVCANVATAEAESFKVNWAAERLTIAAADAPLADVLTEVVRQTGSSVVGVEKLSGTVTIDIRSATLQDALRTLLAGASYVMSVEWPFDSPLGNARVNIWVERPAPSQPCPPAAASVGVAQCVESVARAGVSTDSTVAATAGDSFRFRPSPAEAEAARLVAAGFFNANAPEGSLLAAAKAADVGVRIRALQTLAIQNTKAGSQALVDALDDENPFVRAEALDMLVSLGGSGPDVVRRLGDLLGHKDPGVRFPAAMALGEQSGAEAELQLKRALHDDDGAVRGMAGQLLQQKEQEETRKNR